MANSAVTSNTSLSNQEGATGLNSSKDFDEEKFMKDLMHLRDSQDAIIGLSGWCIRNRKNNAYKIARCWLKCIKKVKIEQKLTLFHLLNDVVQHSRKRNYEELLEKFQAQIREAMPHLKNTKITQKVIRVLNIWIERQVFEEKFIQELISSIDPKQNRAEQDILDNFQPQQLCTQIKIMKALEDDTDYKLRTVKESELNLMEIDEPSLRQNLKDRQHGNDYINDVEEGRKRLEQYIKAIDRELTKRRQVIEMLTHAGKYYDSLLGEANIVATAYTNFGKRVKNLNRKLDERIEVVKDSDNNKPRRHLSGTSSLDDQASEFLEDISPVPSPDYDAPSPKGDELELQLPDDAPASTSNVDAHNPSGNPTSQSTSPQSIFTAKRGSGLTSGDLNSRLDSMASSKLKDLTSYSSMNIPPSFGESSGSNIYSMSEANLSSTLPVAKSSFNGSIHDTSKNTSGFSISEYLTKLAKGAEPATQHYSHQTTSNYSNESMPATATNYSHPPPMPPTNTQQSSMQLNQVPQNASSTETNWWPRQEPPVPSHSTNPPPINAWSSDGDPPPATSWPPPRPDVWSSGQVEQQSWHHSSSQDPVPEWQLPIPDDEPPDSDPAIYNKNTSESYHGNSNLRAPQKSTFDSTTAFTSGTQSREQNNYSSFLENNIVSLTKSLESIERLKGNGQPFSVTGSQHSNASKVVQPSPHSFQSAHLGHADMEMCGDEDDDTTKESQLDNFAYKYDQRSTSGTLGTMQQHNANIPPLMTEEEFNKLKYGTPPQISIPPPVDRHAIPATNSQNGIVSRMGNFNNPPPSFSDSPGHTQFSPMSTQPTRVNPYLPTAPKELTKEEQEEERKTQSLQNRLRSLAGVPLENQSEEKPSYTNSFSAAKDQDSSSGNAYNFEGPNDSSRGSFGSQYNEYRGGHMGGPYNGPRAMMRSPMAGNWRGNPRPGAPLRGGRGMGRGRQGPRW